MVADSKLAHAVTLPDIPVLCVNAVQGALLTPDGEIKTLKHAQLETVLHKKAVMLCHAPYVRSKLQKQEFQAFDVLELFAFVHPASFAVPTVTGLCNRLGLPPPGDFEDQPLSLMDIAKALLKDLDNDPHAQKADPVKIAQVMGLNGRGWPWTPFVLAARGENYSKDEPLHSRTAMNIWRHLPEWAEEAPPPPPSHHGVSAQEVDSRLQELLRTSDKAELRPQQQDYAHEIAQAFRTPQAAEPEGREPHIVLAEAGTGVGKTLGYLAPASIWSEKNEGSVWISTYTKNLQRQINQELDRLYPNPALKDAQVAVRKGRENYLCLLNLEDSLAGAGLAHDPGHAIAAGIMARWAAATNDGDLSGAEFPGWLISILGYANTAGLADRRGECIYSACDHYHRCFVEKAVRKSKRARIVIANHAVVMIQSALSSPGEDIPARYIFDEGHHLFDAADSAYAAHLSARETRDLRRWILGAEGGGRKTRMRGLKRRAEDLAQGDEKAEKALIETVHQAGQLTGEGWTKRFKDGKPRGPAEMFLYLVYQQVHARAEGREGPYSLETPTFPLDEEIIPAAEKLLEALRKLQKPMRALVAVFKDRLAVDEGMMDSDTRKRLDAVIASLERRTEMTLQAWITMLQHLIKDPGAGQDNDFIDWVEIERVDGRAIDVGLFRHYIDPMKPFAGSIRPHLHGMAVTSATLRDESDLWEAAEILTGVRYLTGTPHNVSFASPFDYKEQTKVIIINDVNKNDMRQVAGAYRTLFEASGGGALGLFTAIQRLRAVHDHIAPALEEHHIPLYSQHVDDVDAGTLVDMFREDTHACLLGTDAVRDGVDVPGESLRLIVFDRVPWPRPRILHKARRKAFGGRQYDEMITRLKLKQAFGRLIRRKDDKGVFVMLDSMLPSRLQTAFPAETEILKIGLGEAKPLIKDFLSSGASSGSV